MSAEKRRVRRRAANETKEEILNSELSFIAPGRRKGAFAAIISIIVRLETRKLDMVLASDYEGAALLLEAKNFLVSLLREHCDREGRTLEHRRRVKSKRAVK